MKTNLFSNQANFSELQKGEFNDLLFLLGKDDIEHPELSFIILYKRKEESPPLFMITLSKKTSENPIQSINLYSTDDFDCRLVFTEPTQEELIEIAHDWVREQTKQEAKVWAPPLKHHPVVTESWRTDFGTVLGYQYQYHERAKTEDVQLSFALICFAPQEKKPSLFLYVESADDTLSVHMYLNHKHTLSLTKLNNQKNPRKQLLSVAKEQLNSTLESTPSEDVDFPIPILQLSSGDIKIILRQEQMYEHSLLIILISTIGFILYSLVGIPYIGWFFLILSIFCWLISAAHAAYSYASLTPNYAVRIPASTMLLLPFFFPKYGPALFLFLMMSTPVVLRRAIVSKGIRISGNGIQEDDKLLLVARKMHFDQKKNKRRR